MQLIDASLQLCLQIIPRVYPSEHVYHQTAVFPIPTQTCERHLNPGQRCTLLTLSGLLFSPAENVGHRAGEYQSIIMLDWECEIATVVHHQRHHHFLNST